MKKFRIIYIVYLVLITFAGFGVRIYNNSEPSSFMVYYADKQMMRLVPVKYNVKHTSQKAQCERIIDELTYDRGYDSHIRNLIPEGSVSVKVEDGVAFVNLVSEYFNETERNRNIETLIVYQLVNSVSTVEGVSQVEFLIDGTKQKDFLGFIDMRDSFVPDYYV